ncbi:MAG: UvrD-helicase domain-containing protein [Gammaproteobacteria bacterium]
MSFTKHLEQLNSAQQDAVTAKLGNLLVLAGAGSGKTRVLVNRFAWLLDQHKVEPYNILVVTFTNKAAKEMNIRLNKMNLPSISSSWIGTFHSLSHKLLRLHYVAAGLGNNFEVIDSEDQLKVIRRLIKQLNVNEELFEPKKIQNFINRQKDQGIRSRNLPKISTKYDRIMFEIYGHYENACNAQNIIDFAELLLRSYELLANNQELLQHYHGRFKHFLIDEFQDTNPIQYNFLKLLGANAESVTAVGDDDQSIYGWRGAKVENIAKYTKEFSAVNIIRLEKNYRSTKTILSAANAIINNNFDRMGKTLWTDSIEGAPIVLYAALNEEDEARFMVREIKKHTDNGGKCSDIAILYRSNAQSRIIEESLVKAGILYVIYGGVNFFGREEIRDTLGFLRLAVNPEDNAAFERIVNVPARGIGDKTLEKIRGLAKEENISCLKAAELSIKTDNITGAANQGLTSFINIINEIAEYFNQSNDYSLTELVQKAIDASGLLEHYKKQRDVVSANRVENLQELINATINFNVTTNQANPNNISKVSELLAYAAIEGKEYISKEVAEASSNNYFHVQLMTLHAAKGLEFPIVFLCGLEEGLFPHYFSKDDPDALNEERRLCYVGVTRSMEKIFMSYAQKRRLFGREESRIRSRFIAEIPAKLIEERSKQIFVKYPAKQRFTTDYKHD